MHGSGAMARRSRCATGARRVHQHCRGGPMILPFDGFQWPGLALTLPENDCYTVTWFAHIRTSAGDACPARTFLRSVKMAAVVRGVIALFLVAALPAVSWAQPQQPPPPGQTTTPPAGTPPAGGATTPPAGGEAATPPAGGE